LLALVLLARVCGGVLRLDAWQT
jgi:hypothetical protein